MILLLSCSYGVVWAHNL